MNNYQKKTAFERIDRRQNFINKKPTVNVLDQTIERFAYCVMYPTKFTAFASAGLFDAIVLKSGAKSDAEKVNAFAKHVEKAFSHLVISHPKITSGKENYTQKI